MDYILLTILLSPHWNGSETTVLPNGKDEIKLADGKAVYVEDNYMSVI